MSPLGADHLSRFLSPGTDREVADAYALLPDVARDSSWGFEEELAFLDIETTGFDVRSDSIVEVAVLVAKGPEVLDRYSTLVDPGRAIPRETTQLTGIDDEMVAGAPVLEQAISEIVKRLGDRDIVAHNARFDQGFILDAVTKSGPRIPGAWLDSLQLARIGLPRMRTHRLGDLAEAFGLPKAGHRAADDVEALFGLWRVSLAGVAALPLEVVAAIAALSPDTHWPLRATVAHMAGRGRGRSFDLKRLRTDSVRGHQGPGLVDPDERELTCPPSADVLAEFAAEGAVGRMYAGFETRAEQVRMAEAVLGAFAERRHLAVEAGTGVGKSVAYLVPASRFALENCLGVGVATKTKSLMDQLVYNELPALSKALGGHLLFVGIKGYDNYPCLRKAERLLSHADSLSEDELANLAALLAWFAQTPWGDIDSVNVHWGGERDGVTCSVEDCTSKRCRFYPNLCYLHGVRRRAASAHIVVTNHALLFRDTAVAGGILPNLRYWIVDEAHSAESEARKQLSVAADHGALIALLRALHTDGRGGAVDVSRARGRTEARAHGDDELSDRIEKLAASLRGEISTASTVAESFFDFVKDLGEGTDSDYDSSEMRITPELRETAVWSTAAGVGHSLERRLERIVSQGRELLTALEEAGEKVAEVRADLAGLLSRLHEQLFALETVLDGGSERYVYSAQVSRRRDDRRDALSAQMLDVGAVLAEDFFPQVHSAVFTSATIATGEDFSHFARTVGLDRLEDGGWDALRLESSYDFDRQMAVFVPSDLPEPSGGHLRPLSELLVSVHEAMGGSVLTLFTSRREMEAAYDLVVGPLERAGLPLLLQGRGMSVKRVRDEFLADERVSLFATKSFWEGFDAKGETLRCVVIARLPFGRVRDPLYEERQTRFGRRAWDDFYLPDAVLELKQAAGRLIRSSTDEGCVIVADGRLTSGRRYARTFLDALPVSDVEVLSCDELVRRLRERFASA